MKTNAFCPNHHLSITDHSLHLEVLPFGGRHPAVWHWVELRRAGAWAEEQRDRERRRRQPDHQLEQEFRAHLVQDPGSTVPGAQFSQIYGWHPRNGKAPRCVEYVMQI